MYKTIRGWGRYPEMEAEVLPLDAASSTSFPPARFRQGIARGLARSYGDSSLASTVLDATPMNRMLDFDESTGLLRCEAGVSLAEILNVFVERGWFLPVTPGTKYVTVGGAIASDVHGKNHHRAGCFSDHVEELTLLGPEGRTYRCAPDTRPQLFRATCGGMGLTGIILEASIRLKRIESSRFDVEVHKAKDLEACFRLFEQHADWPYSVAWLDCMATGRRLGRSLLMLGKNRADGRLDYTPPDPWTIPFTMPKPVLNRFTISAFNALYYHRMVSRHKRQIQDIDSFFYPLDALGRWNRMYGKDGFLQYQFVLPKRNSFEGLKRIIEVVADRGKGSFLSVLKLMGPENNNFLSFPMEGYTLALDFKVEPGIFSLLDRLDRIVCEYGGRIYLTKDARMSPEVFRKGYPQLDHFRRIRRSYGMEEVFESRQSQRLNI